MVFERRSFMRILYLSVVMVMVSIASAWSSTPKDRYVVPLKNNVAVVEHFPKTADEQPAFVAGTGDKLMIVGSKPGAYKVLSTKGDIGWIDKVSVRELRPGEAMTFGEADVLGFLDNPTPFYILDPNDPLHSPILLERSFAQELRQNVDRMTIDRIVGENPPSL